MKTIFQTTTEVFFNAVSKQTLNSTATAAEQHAVVV